MCSQWGHHPFFRLFELDVRSRRKSLGVSELSKFFLRWKSVNTMIHKFNVRRTSSSFQQQEKKKYQWLLSFLFLFFNSLRVLLKKWNYLYKKGEMGCCLYKKGEKGCIIFFPLKGGTSLSKKKKACCTSFLAVKEASTGLPVVTAKAKCHLCLEARVPHSSFVSLRCTHSKAYYAYGQEVIWLLAGNGWGEWLCSWHLNY